MNASDIRGMDLNLLSVFVLLWDTRSVSKTSDKLSLSQSAVSHALKRLREALGDPLFLPTRNGLVPTDRASELIIPVREALQKIREAIESAHPFEPISSQREFRIALFDVVEFWLMPDLIERLKEDAPGVTLRSVPVPDAQSAQAMLESGDIDMIVDIHAVSSAFVKCSKLSTLRLVTMIWDKDHVKGPQLPLEIYLERRHIVFQQPDRNTNVVDQALARKGLSRKISVVAKNFLTIPAMAARTGFVITTPERVARLFSQLFGLAIYEPPLELEPIPLYCISHLRFESDAGLRWLRANISELLGSTD